MQQAPLSLSFATEEYFETPELRRAQDGITQKLLSTSEIVLVTAPAGSGKSTLAQRLKAMGAAGAAIHSIAGNAEVSIESITHELARQFFPDREIDRSQEVNWLHKYLEYSVAKGFKPIIVIDDAGSLPVATLHFLLQLAELRYREFSLHFLLLADESIEAKLSGDQFSALTVTWCREFRLPLFTEAQTHAYIGQRLQQSNASYRTLITPGIMDTIHAQSQGQPGKIHAAVQQFLIAHSDKLGKNKGNKFESLTRVTVVGVAVALIVAFVIHYRDDDAQKTTEPETNVAKLTRETSTPLPVTLVTETEVPEEAVAIAIEEETIPPEPVSEEPLVVTQTPPAIEPELQPPTPPELASITDSSEGPDSSDQVRATHLYHLAEIPEYLDGIRGADWLRAQDPDDYCLQLISAQLLSNIEKLLQEGPRHNGDLSGYIKYTPSGKPRYLLFYGIYPDKETATNAVAGIPLGFAKVNPWPQKIAVIVRDLDQVEQRVREEGIPEEGDSPVN